LRWEEAWPVSGRDGKPVGLEQGREKELCKIKLENREPRTTVVSKAVLEGSATDRIRFVLLKVYSGSYVERFFSRQGLANFFCKDTDSMYVRFYEPYGVSQLLTSVCNVKIAIDICK